MKLSVSMFIRDEEKTIGRVIDSLLDQTIPFNDILIIDDCSLDNTVKIIEDRGLKPVKLITRHPSFIGTSNLSLIANECIRAVYKTACDFFAITGGDIILDKDYNEILLRKFDEDPDLVIASGWIRDEYFNEDVPRGCCRFFKFPFWDQHVKAYPYSYGWESYPLYVAMSRGYRIGAFKDAKMKALRRTRSYKRGYGIAMRELGYYTPLALGRCFMAFFEDPIVALKMFWSYISCSSGPIDPDLANWIRSNQQKDFFKKTVKAFNRVFK